MRRISIVIFAFLLTASCSGICIADTEHFQIKMGAHERGINEEYGTPIMEERLNTGFLPITKKKALYKIDDGNYFMIKYFSGRVKELNILEGSHLEDAQREFEKF